MAYDYLSDLNREQRHAVKHGVKDGSAIDAKPLLVIETGPAGRNEFCLFVKSCG